MTSRRIISDDKALFDKDASQKSNITPAVPAWVALLLGNKLLDSVWLMLTDNPHLELSY